MQQHLSTTQKVAAGLRSLPQTGESFAAAQGAWRFFANYHVTLPVLAAPILDRAREASENLLARYALVMHDFSGVDFSTHASKADRISLYKSWNLGYFLQSALLVSDISGSPLAPLYLGLEAADGVHSSRRAGVLPRRPQLDELNRTFGYVESLGLARPCVHIVDRQADSLVHLRRFVRCGRQFVIRSDEIRRVNYEGRSLLLKEVESELREHLKFVREVEYKGDKAFQYVTQAKVRLERVGRARRPTAENKQKRKYIKGRAIDLRFIFSEVRTEKGEVLATWRLWTNLDETVEAAEVTLWYYWRWRIESFFKLLKSGGQCLEQWQQESASAIAKRLMVVAQVCVIVWALAADESEKAAEMRRFLISLSGRLMKLGVEYTMPALMTGMWQLLSIIDALERYTPEELFEIAREFLEIVGDKPNFKGRNGLV